MRHRIVLLLVLLVGCVGSKSATRSDARTVVPAPSGPAARPQPPTVSFDAQVSGKGPLLVLIPGLACTSALFADFVATAREKFEVHALTLAGFGVVPPATGPPLERARRELVLYLRALGKGKAIIVGHSMGAMVAYAVASSAPDVVDRIVALDGVPFLPALLQPGIPVEQARVNGEQMSRHMASLPAAEFQSNLRMNITMMAGDEKTAERVVSVARTADQKTVADAAYEVFTLDLRDDMNLVTAPILIIVGVKGIDSAHLRRAYEDQFKGARSAKLVFSERGRHFLFLQAPDEILALTEAFLLASVPAPHGS